MNQRDKYLAWGFCWQRKAELMPPGLASWWGDLSYPAVMSAKAIFEGGLALTEAVSTAVCVQPPLSGTCVLFCASVFFLCLLMFSLTLAHFTCILTWNGTKWHQMHFIISSSGIDDILVLNTPPHTAVNSLTQHLTLTLQSAPSHNIRVAISWPWHWLVILLATKSTRLRVVKVDLIRNK